MTHSLRLVADEHPLIVLPTLAAKIGLNEAIVLQQIHYWLGKECGQIINGIRWIYNRLDDWLEQFPWMSKWRLRQTLGFLRDLGIVKFAQHEKKLWLRRGWYTIDYKVLKALHVSMCEDANFQESVEQIFDVATSHTSQTETISETSQRQQHNAADCSNDLQEEDCKPISFASLPNQSDLASDKPEFESRDSSSIANVAAQQILAEVKNADIPLTPELQRLVLKSSVEVVRDAISVVLEARQKGTVFKPAGLLTRAIQGQWQPTTKHEDKYPQGFLEAYQRLCDTGVVIPEPVESLPVVMGEINVRVPTPNHKTWEPPYQLLPWRVAIAMC